MKLSNTMMINEKLLPTSKKAFTLAEVLITLSILGVVAALTIPTLVNRQSDMAAITRVTKAVSSFEDFAAIYMAESGNGNLTSLTCANLSEYFKQVQTANGGCDFTTADGVAWHFEVAEGNLTGYATAIDNQPTARYGVGLWATNNVVNSTGSMDGVSNTLAVDSPNTIYSGAAFIAGRGLAPANVFLQATTNEGRTCANGIAAIEANGTPACAQ